jgi:hypothetical protein
MSGKKKSCVGGVMNEVGSAISGKCTALKAGFGLEFLFAVWLGWRREW